MIGIVAGSFDPITVGHTWLIKRALELLGSGGGGAELHVVIGVNPAKKYFFSEDERKAQVYNSLKSELTSSQFDNVWISTLTNDLLINYAKSVNASYIFRGIRNTSDFNYESQIQQVNRKICPEIETVFFIPPSEMTEISSSTVRGLVGFNGWERIVSNYVHSSVVDSFKEKLK